MIRTITLEQYENYIAEWCCSLVEQHIGSGVEITLTLECDDDYYYLTSCVSDYERDIDFCKENGYDTKIVDETVDDCEKFGCKICDSLEEVNECVKEMLDESLFFSKMNMGIYVRNQ